MAGFLIEDYAQKTDEDIVVIVVDTTQEVLKYILRPESKIVRSNEHTILQKTWHNFSQRITEVKTFIRNNFATATDLLKDAGMLGRELRMKFELLLTDLKEGIVKRVLNRIDLILDSLKAAFPPLEAVIEYKKHVEASIEDQNDPDSGLTTVFSNVPV